MQTRNILVTLLRPGMIAAEDVFTSSNHLVIQKDTELTEHIITRLRYYSIPRMKVYVPQSKSDPKPETAQAPPSEAPQPEKPKPEASNYREQVVQSPEFRHFQSLFTETISAIKVSFNTIISSAKDINPVALLAQTKYILSGARNGNHLFDMLHCMRSYDDTTFTHSINVSLICNILGQWLHFPQEELDTLTLAGLLHDIGKLMIPHDIIDKPGKLSPAEYALVQTHTMLGFNCLRDRPLDDHIKNAALMHHERCDGSGYPNRIMREQIDEYAKIVAIADVYDAMSSNRSYRQPVCPFEIIEKFEEDGLQTYDPKYILVFLEGIVQTYLHNTVMLNNGEVGEIVLMNKQSLSRPFIKTETGFIDLSSRTDLSIRAIL